MCCNCTPSMFSNFERYLPSKKPYAVNLEIFARILEKDIFAALKISDNGMIYLYQ